jgi:hypothetical protein
MTSGVPLNLLGSNAEKILVGGEHTSRVLREIGAMMALDVITNNCDRLPLVWSNRGNQGNIYFSENGPHAVSIDSKIVPIDAEKSKTLYENYTKRVVELLAVRNFVENLLVDWYEQAVAKNPLVEIAAFRSVRDSIMSCTGCDIQREGIIEVEISVKFQTPIFYVSDASWIP